MKNEIQKKLTLEEYEQKYSHRENAKAVKSVLILLEALIGVGLAAILFFVVMRLFEIHKIAGYAGIGAAVIVFICFYIIPIVKIRNTKAFETNVNKYNASSAKRHNKKLRAEIADKFIEFSESTDGVGWYNSELVGKLAIARQTNNEEETKKVLTEIFDTDVKKTAKSIIREHAMQVGMVTAISQSENLDTMFMAIYELNLIKRLVFLYGFRPSDTRLMRIYMMVLKNALMAYGLESVANNLATGIVQKIGGALTGIPALGSVVSTVISSASQGVINGGLTVIIGHQTLSYLNKEYHMQDLLDKIELDDIDEKAMMEDVKEDIIKESKKLKKKEA
ncbi:MAG: DUF697 domain-containing protein [Bacilli bacterium]|nr:DUF697 domain-containing protein [Bacilli bacterium]